ncbi:hypothetical protein METSCH_A02060 [Metschnikowia aff. pulcherrima]|uniref:Uncharacterized protein n=1 Tax=Metschnikowia aff. pulcherrima TaxID=2163413 RepID=A0A4P6XJA0_9ASCO|nr:hypothetical protein METSCH_A02060 [Metschnikowia aff. pulcherrima]
MKLVAILTAGSLLTGSFVNAAPRSSAANIVKRNDFGDEMIDFDYVIRTVKSINERYANKDAKSLQKRDDLEFIDQLMVEFHNHNLLDEFVHQLAETPRLRDSVEKGVLSSISLGKASSTVLLSSLRNSGQLNPFIDSVLNDEDLNDELYASAREILLNTETKSALKKRQALDDAEHLIKALYHDTTKRDIYQNGIVLRQYGVAKREIVSTVISIIEEIYDSEFVQDIIHSIIGNQSLISYAIGLFQKIFQSINWSSLFTAIKNSGIIRTLFASVLSLLTSLFSGSSISSLIDELFGGGSNSTHKSFLATLLSAGVEIGSDLFRSLTNSSSSGSSNSGGLLSELLDTFLNGTSSVSSGDTSSSSTSASFGGFLSGLISGLFGGSASSSSSSGLSSTATATGVSSSSTSGGLLSTIFDDIFGNNDSASTGSDDSGSSSGSSSGSTPGSSSGSSSSGLSGSSGGSFISSLIDGLFGGDGLSSSLTAATKTSSAISSASSSVFSSKKACCCSALKIKKRALKRALTKKVKRSVRRTFSAGSLSLPEEMMRFFYIK